MGGVVFQGNQTNERPRNLANSGITPEKCNLPLIYLFKLIIPIFLTIFLYHAHVLMKEVSKLKFPKFIQAGLLPSNTSYDIPKEQFAKFVLDKAYASSFPGPLKEYILWHASIRECLRHDQCGLKKPKILVWRCPDGHFIKCAGLGDRLRGIQAALLFSIASKRLLLIDMPNRPFSALHGLTPSLIDWRPPPDLQYDKWPLFVYDKWPWFIWRTCPSTHKCNENVTSLSHHDVLRRKVLPRRFDLSMDDISLYLQDIENVVMYSRSNHTVQIMSQLKGLESLEDFRNGRMSDIGFLRFLMKALFQPSPAVATYLKSLFPSDGHEKGYISIHARTGHDFGEDISRRFSANKNQYRSIANKFILCAKELGLKSQEYIFFASDPSFLKSEMVNASIDHNIKIAFSDIPAIHVGLGIPRGLRSSNSSLMYSFLNVFVEFFGIAGGKVVISNKSEFSRLAYIFGDARDLKSVNLSSNTTHCE